MEANIDRFTKAFADAWNSLGISPIEHLLADDFHYSSFWVLEEMTTAAQYLTYLRGKFNTIRKTGSVINAEQIPGKNFIVLMQDGIRKSGIILTINNDDMILRADMMPLEFCR